MDQMVVEKKEPPTQEKPPDGMSQPPGQGFEYRAMGGGGSQKQISEDETQGQEDTADPMRNGQKSGERQSINLKMRRQDPSGLLGYGGVAVHDLLFSLKIDAAASPLPITVSGGFNCGMRRHSGFCSKIG